MHVLDLILILIFSTLKYRQSLLTIFTKANPAGDVTSRDEYLRFLVMLIFLGCSVSVKRVCLGYYFGRRICGTLEKQFCELSHLISSV